MTKAQVAVALSGGTDSSVAALLLKETGHEVLGLHMRLWDSSSSQQQENQAKNICSTLNIPFHMIDLRREFEHYVIDYFCQEYRQGRTPNPCIACNQHIKFGFLLDKALSLGVDYLATGHYARIEYLNDGYHLLKASDTSKDQSYFLYTLSQEKLGRILFPLGRYTKAEVKRVANVTQDIIPHTVKSSQDICFISPGNYRTFLSQRFLSMPGDILDSKGEILGHHQGIAFYTIGQRHGLGLASGKPLYVTKIEPEHNRIVLGGERELYSHKVTVKELSWIADKWPIKPIAVTAKIRYKSKQAEAILFPTCRPKPKLQAKRRVTEAISDVCFSQPQKAITPGQAIVFYNNGEVLGGGIVEGCQSTISDNEGEKYITAAKF